MCGIGRGIFLLGWWGGGHLLVESLSAYHLYGNPAIPGRIKMAWFISVECFRKKGNTFRGIPFSRFYWNSRKFVYHLFTITSARLFPRRQQCPRRRILSDESLLFQTVRDVTAVLFSRLLLTDVLQQSCSTQGEKDLSFGCRYLFYFCFHDSSF